LTKNGTSREVPLPKKAVKVLRNQRSRQGTPTPFPVNANAFRLAWERLRKRADLCDLRFHDLRHEAISRFFEMGLSVPEVAVISGHKDARMLFRYTHLRAENIIAKLV
jgi:integrase